LPPAARTVPPRLAAWAIQEVRTRALGTVVAKLGEEGISCLPVKGILLARQLYEEPIDRPFCDVDLLLRPSDFRKAIRVAKRSSWCLCWDAKILGSVNFIVGETAFDTVCSLGPPGLCAVGVDQVIERAKRTVEPLGFLHLQIDQHDHALLLAIDAFKDKFGVKPWCREDLIRIANGNGFSTERLVDLAGEAGLRTMLAIVADWVLDGADAPSWQDVRRRLAAGKVRGGYARLYRSLLGGPITGLRSVPLALLARAASDVPARRAMAVSLGAIGTLAFLARHRSFTMPISHG
jgi:hypothetical protein